MAADPFDLTGRVVVVTGGLGQLGRQFTAAVAGRGARAVALDLPTARRDTAAPACVSSTPTCADATRSRRRSRPSERSWACRTP